MYTEPYSDTSMTYDYDNHRYVLTENFVRDSGIDLSLHLNTEQYAVPSKAPGIFLDRISQLVYGNIYNYGRERETKEFLLACDEKLRPAIRDAMLERIRYMASSGDLSVKSGALIQHGTRIEVEDLISSPQEKDILRATGILHRGKYFININSDLTY
jgi:hypothetical protein